MLAMRRLAVSQNSANIFTYGKRPDGIVIIESAVPECQMGTNGRHDFVGRVSIERYKSWPPYLGHEGQEELFGRIVLSTHSDSADPRFFFTFASEQSSVNRKLPSPASGRCDVSQVGEFDGAPDPSMTGDVITQETTDQTSTSAGKNLPHSCHNAGAVRRK